MFRFWGKKRKNTFFREIFIVNQISNKFIVCVWTAMCTTLKKQSKSWHFWRNRMFTIFSKIAIFKNWLQILKIVQSVKLRPKHAFFWTLTTRPYLQSRFSPFYNWKFQPILHISGLNSKFWIFNNTVVMRVKMFPKMLSKVFIDHLKALATLDFSYLLFSLHSFMNKCIDFFSLPTIVILGH